MVVRCWECSCRKVEVDVETGMTEKMMDLEGKKKKMST